MACLLCYQLVEDYSGPVLFYDDHCPLCYRSVRFLLWADRRARLRFASLQSPKGVKLDLPHGLDSVVLNIRGVNYYYSDAIGLALKELKGVWAMLGWVILIWPSWLRNGVYRIVAALRPVSKQCALIPEAYRDRFLES